MAKASGLEDLQKGKTSEETLEVIPEVERVADTPKINGASTTNGLVGTTTTHALKRHRTRSDPDAQDMVIASLRSQIQDLFSQVTQLNTKLVNSYDRVSDLEDDLHVASATVRSSTLKISQLELERTQHLSALNTGLLVEKSHVTSELNRLMEKATEEAAQRGQAESARRDIEKDLDDLSATLFGQANTMVAEARFAQHLSEQKVAEAERALKGAEEAVGVMQQQMQALQSDKEEAEERAEKALVAMGKGKHTERRESPTFSIRLLSSHLPYQEFLLFVAHLRSIHISSPQPPAITTLLPLPFLTRLLNEDSEPTVRLDLAPSLNWLSRRSVLAAIHNGQLIIEPVTSATLLQEAGTPGLNSSSNNISCALCGIPIFSTMPESSHNHSRPILGQSNSNSMSWSASLFKKPANSTSYSISSNNSQPPTPPPRSGTTQFQQILPPQVYIFRLASQTSTTSSIPIPSLPRVSSSTSSSSSSTLNQPTDNIIHSSSTAPQSSSTIYPLCANTWCLSRLRATCTIWAFVRTSIIEKVWEEEVPTLLPPTIATSPTTEKPPVPPRRRGLWGMASALGERATSWGGEGDKDKAKKAAPAAPEAKPTELRRLPPPPPPIHPTVKEADVPVRRNLPPPLPKRSEVRHQATSAEKTPPESTPTTHAIAPTADEPSPTPAHKEPALPPRPPRRPITPESVPLPDSRPPTPLVAPVPAPAAIATGSPVPPPLPRRAAARASRVIADGAVSRPATPRASEPIAESKEEDFTAAKVEPTETKADVEAEVATSPVDESNGASEQASEEGPALTPGGDPAPPADTPVAVDESAAKVASEDVSSSSEASPGSEGEVSAEASTVTEPTAKEGVNGEEAVVDAPAVKNEPEAKKVADGADSSPEGVNAGTASPEEVAPPPYGEEKQALAEPEKEKKDEEAKDGEETEPAASEVESEETSAVVARDTKSDDQSEKKAEDDKEAYIGDTTWEERTWKEIVRLKEEMFWARIGGVRQSE